MTSTSEKAMRIAEAAQQAAKKIALTSGDKRNDALRAMAEALRNNTPDILKANAQDVDAAQEKGTKDSLIDRLMLNEQRIADMASALEDLVSLPDPVGVIQQERVLYNGIKLQRKSVPLGVVAVIYEARPNVTADAAGICLKSGNACILRGGSLAARTNKVIAEVMAQASVLSGMPEGSIQSVDDADRSITDALMQLHGVVDVVIPRGGAGLIQHCLEHSKVPVIETGTGNCHVYIHESADLQKAKDIVLNAKCRRYGVCNAAETLLVDKGIAENILPNIVVELAEQDVLMHCDEQALSIAQNVGISEDLLVLADEDDWWTEYLGPEIAIRCICGVGEAIGHINKYGTHHSESIVAKDEAAIERFLDEVDAAAVYSNASTAFTDGGQFGLGAEIGISTQKLHARGPFALEALTSYKYVLRGDGQVRS